MVVLATLGAIMSLVCLVIILIQAFQDEVWKGLLGLLCMFYLVYFAILEFEHERKWLIVAGWLGGAVLSGLGATQLSP